MHTLYPLLYFTFWLWYTIIRLVRKIIGLDFARLGDSSRYNLHRYPHDLASKPRVGSWGRRALFTLGSVAAGRYPFYHYPG